MSWRNTTFHRHIVGKFNPIHNLLKRSEQKNAESRKNICWSKTEITAGDKFYF